MHRLQAPDVVHAIERAASEHLGRPWKAREFVSLDDRASHPAGILRGDSPVGHDAHGRHVAPSRNGGLDVFAKFGAGDNAAIGFGRELDGLALLRDLGGAQTARPVANGVISVHDGCVLALEAVPERSTRERSSADWRSIGAALASLHALTGTTFGLDVDGSFGPLTQLNGAVETNRWCDFIRERRIEPFLVEAQRSGNLPDGFLPRVHAVMQRLDEFGGPDPVPTLLHGDAQQNNFLSTDEGTVFVDTSPFFGHPENDLAMLDLFEPVPGEVFDAYRECRGLAHGFEERCELWRIPIYLAIVAVDGSSPFGRTFISRLDDALRTFG